MQLSLECLNIVLSEIFSDEELLILYIEHLIVDMIDCDFCLRLLLRQVVMHVLLKVGFDLLLGGSFV